MIMHAPLKWILWLLPLVWFTGCSAAPETNEVEKEVLATLITDYQLEYHEKDDQGRVIDLRLEGDRFDNDAMEYVRKFKMLIGLSLMRSSVTDAGMEKIQELKRLQRINLVSTAVTDLGLSYLEKMPSLQNVWLLETKTLTARGIDSLKSAVPGINVHVMNEPNKSTK